MKFIPDKLGAEPKKLAMLGVLVVVLGAVYFMNRADTGPPQSAQAALPGSPRPIGMPRVAPAGIPSLAPAQRAALARRSENSIQDFKPSLKLPEGMDVSRIDPSLHMDLIAKLRAASFAGGERSLFDFGPAPRVVPPKVDPIKPSMPPASDPNAPVISAIPPSPPPTPGKLQAPPIPLKFYGYVNGSVGGTRQAFFLQGDDIFVASENELIQNRYKVIRIGVNSAVIEDTTNSNQQTIPLVQELAG